jgi:hypothetical protein
MAIFVFLATVVLVVALAAAWAVFDTRGKDRENGE